MPASPSRTSSACCTDSVEYVVNPPHTPVPTASRSALRRPVSGYPASRSSSSPSTNAPTTLTARITRSGWPGIASDTASRNTAPTAPPPNTSR